MIDWQDISLQIFESTGLMVEPLNPRSISGGCINQCYVIGLEGQQVFIKLNQLTFLDMFRAEAQGLATIARTSAISVPKPLFIGCSYQHAFLAMQCIPMGSPGAKSYVLFGQQLAEMHRHKQERYGSARNNSIGSTPQINALSDNWFDFWRETRLGYQLKLALKNGASSGLFEDGMRLAENFHTLFSRPPPASCLHGDLWQGNWSFNRSGLPVIFDPAHYFGDRETDLAMTTLFGRAPDEFYQAYKESYPLEEGYPVRETLYNIYHVLNHYNLFGGSYAPQAHDMILYVLSELK